MWKWDVKLATLHIDDPFLKSNRTVGVAMIPGVAEVSHHQSMLDLTDIHL